MTLQITQCDFTEQILNTYSNVLPQYLIKSRVLAKSNSFEEVTNLVSWRTGFLQCHINLKKSTMLEISHKTKFDIAGRRPPILRHPLNLRSGQRKFDILNNYLGN